jgi:hypothetical protein
MQGKEPCSTGLINKTTQNKSDIQGKILFHKFEEEATKEKQLSFKKNEPVKAIEPIHKLCNNELQISGHNGVNSMVEQEYCNEPTSAVRHKFLKKNNRKGASAARNEPKRSNSFESNNGPLV